MSKDKSEIIKINIPITVIIIPVLKQGMCVPSGFIPEHTGNKIKGVSAVKIPKIAFNIEKTFCKIKHSQNKNVCMIKLIVKIIISCTM